jgi:uncharacterized RDD family membrane protein YckC
MLNSASPPAADYPGQRLGLPPAGTGSVAGWGRRVLALGIDWVLSLLVVSAVTQTTIAAGGGRFSPLLVFGLEAWILTSLLGGSAGQLVVGVRVVRTNGEWLDPGRALLRTFLILLVIPPVIYNHDQRGLHDIAVDSVAVKR